MAWQTEINSTGGKHVRRFLTAIAAAVAAVALLSAPAGAVQGGTPDGSGHPNVGLSVFLYNGIPLWRCSGTMVAAQVYLTAGHCTGIDPDLGIAPNQAQVWFDSGPIPLGSYAFDGKPCKATDTGYRARASSVGRQCRIRTGTAS